MDPAQPEDENTPLIKEVLEPYMNKDGTYRVVRTYLDLAVNKEPIGRVEIDLPNIKKCPKTSANFIALCHGGYGKNPQSDRNLHYKGSTLFRIVSKVSVCGGDLVEDKGTSGTSIYSKQTFDDEQSGMIHDKPGIVSMLQESGEPNTNGSQFTILLVLAPWLDKMYVPFGIVTEGTGVLERVCEKYGSENGAPTSTVKVFDAGIK